MSEGDLVQRVYREFSLAPLRPEQEALYVDLNAARGDMDVVSLFERTIRFAEGRATCQLVAGHKGNGKSTELLRLKKRLESTGLDTPPEATPGPEFIELMPSELTAAAECALECRRPDGTTIRIHLKAAQLPDLEALSHSLCNGHPDER